MTDIKTATAKLLKDEFFIDESVTTTLFNRGILHEPDCRNVLIKAEYKRKVQPKEKQRLKGKLAEKFCVSVELIEKIIKK